MKYSWTMARAITLAGVLIRQISAASAYRAWAQQNPAPEGAAACTPTRELRTSPPTLATGLSRPGWLIVR